MKYLKSIDFAAQTIICLGLLGGGLVILFAGEGLGTFFYIGLIAQFFIGCWQMISSALFMVLRAENFKARSFHFVSGLLCLGAIALIAGLSKELDSVFSNALLLITGVVVPWCLAIFYCTITWRWMFPQRSSGRFLPHISF